MSRIFKPISDIRKEKRRAKILTRTRIVVAVVLCILLFYVLVSYSGHWLVRDDSFEHVNWVVVLDGQSGDLERSDYAAKLVREGKADSVLILGRRVFRDKNNADFYAEDMEEVGGVDPSRIYIYRHDDPSTIEEAVSVIPWFKRRAPKDTVLLLTAAPATRRAAFLFNTLSGGHPAFITVDLHDWRYNAKTWIFEREARKNWLREWAAILNAKWDLLGVDTLLVSDRPVRFPERWENAVSSKTNVTPPPLSQLVSIKKAIASQDSTVKEIQTEAQQESMPLPDSL
ncbi:MAG: ElyC/SanA/YdcF family protein [Hallerella succinigenes]|uniref:ElyC/SanA/YdcF family protein n=1 Tax=Hallerella succinigenes TaxID=1896222 RepID=UPI0023F453C3|nr:ElyC/SanA/YdcF family protein [Hallerella succinigenes]MDD6091070.1 ElyC/SanA/YdcF family protein [Hallerella succinigenes]